MAKSTVGVCCPRCRSILYWLYTPDTDGKVGIELKRYTFTVTNIDATNHGNGTATAAAWLWIEVKDHSDGSDEPFVRHWVEKQWASIAGYSPKFEDSDRQNAQLVVNLKANHTYQIRAALKAQATRGSDCGYGITKCESGNGIVDAEATVEEVWVYPLERPWVSLEYRGRSKSYVVEYDTWNAYEYLDWQAREKAYYADRMYFIVSAGGYDETLSYVDVSVDGDSITGWVSSPADLSGTVTQPDVLRLHLPDPTTLEAWGGSWFVEVDINPEIDERNLVPCGTMFPVMPLLSDSTAVVACTTWANVTLDEFYDRGNWRVNGFDEWIPVDSALVNGWAWSVIDTAGVRFEGVDPAVALDELFQVGGLGYDEPTLQSIYDEIEARCRGIDATGPDNPIVFTTFPLGENSYTEERTWRVDAYTQGRDDNAHLSDADSIDIAMHVNFDFWPRYLDPLTAVESRSIPVSRLKQNYPNPFNPATTIEFSVAEKGRVTLRIYDVAGHAVATLVDGIRTPGTPYVVEWTGRDSRGNELPTGVYFCRLSTRNAVETRKMVLIR